MASSSASRSEASLSLLDTHNQQTIDNLSSFLHQPLHDLIATIALNQDSLILERAIHVLLTRQNLSEKDTLTEAEFAPYLKASNAFFSTPTEPVVSVHNRLLLQGLYEYLVTKNFADAKAYFISRTKSEIAPNTIKGLAYFLLGIMNQPKKIARSYFQKAIQHGSLLAIPFQEYQTNTYQQQEIEQLHSVADSPIKLFFASWHLAKYYHQKQPELSIKYYRHAAEQHYAPAAVKLILAYQNGHGVTKSTDEALALADAFHALFKKISIKDKFIEMKINILLKLNRSNAAKQECSRIISLSQRAFIHADILKKDIEFQKLTEEAGTCKFTDKFLSVLDNYSLAYQHAENKEQKIAAFQALNNLYTTVSSAANSAIVMKTLFATAMAIPIYNEKKYNFELIRQFKHIKYLFDAHIALSKATIGNEPILNYCAIKTDLKQLEKVLSLSTLLQYLKNEILLSPDRKSTAKMSDFDLKNQYLRYFRFYLQQMDHQKFARIIKEFDRIVDAANPEVGCILAMDAAIAELTAAKANNSSQFTRLVSSAKAEFDVMAETAISTLKALVLQRKQDYAAQLGNDVDSKKNSKP